jgi:outer membrane protein
MNKIKLFLLATVVTVAAGNVQAQSQKAGYMNIEQMLSIMPEVGKIDTLLKKFQTDSLNTEFAGLIQDYNYRDSMLNKTDTVKMPASIKREHRQQLESIAYQVQNWQQISQNVMQSKQQELLAPIYQKIYTAINQVAKESGYTYVYKEEALIVAPPGDNMLPLVAKKLNVKLPMQNSGAAAGKPGTAANKPGTVKKSQ